MQQRLGAIVTGSTSGIGLAIAKALAHAGHHVMLNGFGDAAAIEKLRSQLAQECGVKVAYSGADMTRPEQIAQMVQQAEGEFGSVDGMIDKDGGVENVSNITRLAAVRAGMSMFREHPVFGVGFAQYGFNYPSHIHMDDMRSSEVRSYVTEADVELAWPPAYSLHVRLLAELGITGYLSWLSLILPVLLRSLMMSDGTTYLGRMHLAVAMTLIGWMLLGVSIDSFRFFGGWIALGVGLALPRPPRSFGDRPVAARSSVTSP